MIRKKLLKITLITTVIACILTSTACGKKTANNNNTTSETKATVSTETKSIAAKELTKTELVTFDYTDADGNTYTLEGKAVANESGDATIEVSDNNGNKVTFTGKAATNDGKMTVSNITVKDAGTLVKADGTEIKVTTGTTVADATKSDETTSSDIAASEDVKQEVENSQKEEAIIEEAKEAVTKAEESADNTENKENDSNDTVIADNGDSNNNDNNNGDSDNNVSGDKQETPVEDNKKDNNETPANPNPTPEVKEEEKEETPAPAPAPAPTPVAPTPAPEPEKPILTEEQQLVATGKWTKKDEWESMTGDGSICRKYEYKDSITGYSLWASFRNGVFYLEQSNSYEEAHAIYSAHGITDTVYSFERLLKLSNS